MVRKRKAVEPKRVKASSIMINGATLTHARLFSYGYHSNHIHFHDHARTRELADN